MSRPAQLEQQIARVKELQAEMLEGDNQNNSGTPQGDPPPDSGTPPAVVEPPATVSKDEYNKLEQRYRTLQGMHAADTQRLRSELSARDTAIQDLENRLVDLEKAATATPATVNKYVTAEDVEEYGNTVDMVRRAAREEAEALVAKQEQSYLARIAQLEKELGHVRNTVVPTVEDLSKAQIDKVKAEFWSAIETNVPDWRKINDDQAFKDWLLTEDPLTGATRQQFLSQAQHNLDASRVIRFFAEWKRTSAGGQTPAPTSSNDLERFVAPGSSKGAGVPATTEKKVWTSAEVAKFYADATRGVYVSRPEEKKRIENDIFLAQKEGRYKQS